MHIPQDIADAITSASPEKNTEEATVIVANEPETKKPTFIERILNGYDIALVRARQIEDQVESTKTVEYLSKSAINGSKVVGVYTPEAVREMFKVSSNWQWAVTTLPDNIVCLQGQIPTSRYNAFAAYATVSQIYRAHGYPGTNEVRLRPGTIRSGDFYLGTTYEFPTNNITVHLTTDPETGLEYVKKWFAGIEVASVLQESPADWIVRCGIKSLPPKQVYAHERQVRPRHNARQPYTQHSQQKTSNNPS